MAVTYKLPSTSYEQAIGSNISEFEINVDQIEGLCQRISIFNNLNRFKLLENMEKLILTWFGVYGAPHLTEHQICDNFFHQLWDPVLYQSYFIVY